MSITGESQPTECYPERHSSKFDERIVREGITKNTSYLFQEYAYIVEVEVVPGDVETDSRTESILGGSVPSSAERPDDYIDITLVNNVFNFHRMTTVIAGDYQYEISPEGVVTRDDNPFHELTGNSLRTLSFLLKQREPVARYSHEATLRLAELYRQSK